MPLDLLKVEDNKIKQDRYSFCFPADVESLLQLVLTFNSEFLKTMIYTFVYVNHKMPSFGQSLPQQDSSDGGSTFSRKTAK